MSDADIRRLAYDAVNGYGLRRTVTNVRVVSAGNRCRADIELDSGKERLDVTFDAGSSDREIRDAITREIINQGLR